VTAAKRPVLSTADFNSCSVQSCAPTMVVGGGVGWSYDRRRRRAAHFSSAAAAAASDRMREH